MVDPPQPVKASFLARIRAKTGPTCSLGASPAAGLHGARARSHFNNFSALLDHRSYGPTTGLSAQQPA